MRIDWKDLFFNYDESLRKQLLTQIDIAQLNEKDSQGDVPILLACKQGSTHLVEVLIEKKVDLNVSDADSDGNTPLILVCERGMADLAELLIRNGAQIHLENRFGSNALSVACEFGHEQIVTLLIEKGANLDHVNKDDETPLLLACQNGHKEIVEMLIAHGANLNHKKNNHLYGPSFFTDEYNTPLFVSCLNGYKDIANLLIKSGVQIDIAGDEGETLLSEVCRRGYKDIVDTLIELGANVNIDYLYQQSPLLLAYEIGHKQIVKLLQREKSSSFKTHMHDNYEIRDSNTIRNYFKDIFDLLRIRLIRNLHSILANTERNQLYKNILDSLDRNRQLYLIKYVHIEAFRMIDVNETQSANSNFDELRQENILEYFQSVDLRNKLTMIIRNLSSQLELLLKAKHKIVIQFYELNYWKTNVRFKFMPNMKYLELKAICTSEKLLDKINCETSKEDRMSRAHEFIEKIEYYYERIRDYLALVEDLYDVLSGEKMRAFLQAKYDNAEMSSNSERRVLKQHTSANKSPLIIASKKGRLDLVDFLIKQQRADLNYQDSKGKSALLNACFNNHLDIATYLIRHGAQVNMANQYGETALFFAYTSKSMLYKYYSYEKLAHRQLSNSNMLSLVDLLIQKGADINHQNIYGQSVLHKVCEEGNLELVTYLVEKGADMNLKDNYDQTPILIALKSKCVSIFNYLLESGAALNVKDKDGNNLLMVACDKGYSLLAKTLIEKGVSIKTRDKHGNSPFYLACLNCNREVVELFIKKGARLNEPNKKGENALFFACLDGNKQKVDLLIRHSVQINQTNREGENALFYACRDEYCNIYKPKSEQMYEIVKLLMESGIDRELRNNQGRTALFIACENDDYELVRLILNGTRELLIEDEIGNTLLSVAVKHSSADIVNLIRNRLIENIYNEFQYKDAGKFRDLIAHSIDNGRWFVFKWDHLKAFDLLDQKGNLTDLEELKSKGILRYFTTVEFQQRFLTDILDNLKNHREFLESEKRKVEHSFYFENLKSSSSSLDYKTVNYLNKKAYFKYAELKELLKENEIIRLIEREKSKEAEESMTVKLLNSLRVLIQSVDEKLQLSNDFNAILYQKVLLKYKKRNRIKKMLGYYE